MTYPAQRKPPDYSLATGLKMVGLFTAIGLVVCGGLTGVATLSNDSDDDPRLPVVGDVGGSVEPTGRYNIPTTPAVTASPTASPSPTLSPTAPPKPPVKKPPAAPKTTRAPEPPPEDDEPDDVYYANCAEARAAGAAPLYRGEPGYRSALDRDKDGVACES